MYIKVGRGEGRRKSVSVGKGGFYGTIIPVNEDDKGGLRWRMKTEYDGLSYVCT